MKLMENPAIWRCSNEDYHAERAHESSSTLSCFRASRPLYHGRFVTGTIPRSEPTPAMQLGTAFHVRRLEPDTWSEQIAVKPDGIDRRTNVGKIAWAGFVAESAGKTIITQEQADVIERMVAGVAANPMAADLLDAPGHSEFSLRWELDGVKVKTRIDRWLGVRIIADLKTSSDPSPEAFSRDAFRHGYHRQAWLYRRSVLDVFGADDVAFLHVVCGTEEPYECHVYELDDQALALGEREVMQAIADLRRCRESGNWSSPLSGRVNTLSLPRFAFL